MKVQNEELYSVSRVLTYSDANSGELPERSLKMKRSHECLGSSDTAPGIFRVQRARVTETTHILSRVIHPGTT